MTRRPSNFVIFNWNKSLYTSKLCGESKIPLNSKTVRFTPFNWQYHLTRPPPAETTWFLPDVTSTVSRFLEWALLSATESGMHRDFREGQKQRRFRAARSGARRRRVGGQWRPGVAKMGPWRGGELEGGGGSTGGGWWRAGGSTRWPTVEGKEHGGAQMRVGARIARTWAPTGCGELTKLISGGGERPERAGDGDPGRREVSRRWR